jgi:biopolymer transport protein ExbD
MRFKRRKTREGTRANLDITPLIDVVFQLVLFFMLSSTFVVQASIPIELSQSDSAEQLEQKDATVTLSVGEGGPDNKGQVVFTEGDRNVPIAAWAELTDALSKFHLEQPDGLLLVRPDRRVATERLVKVLGIANNVGIVKYGIAASPPAAEETPKEAE